MLADEVPGSVFVRARGPLEWKLSPARLDDVAVSFVTSCFDEPARGRMVGS